MVSFIEECLDNDNQPNINSLKRNMTFMTIDEIEEAVIIVTGMTMEGLRARKKGKTRLLRTEDVAMARHIIYVLAYYYTPLSNKSIAQRYLQHASMVPHAKMVLRNSRDTNGREYLLLLKAENLLNGRLVSTTNKEVLSFLQTKFKGMYKDTEYSPYHEAVLAYNEALENVLDLFR